MPLPHRDLDDSNKTIGWYITSKEYEFCGSFNEIQGFNTQYNSCLERCGIEVRLQICCNSCSYILLRLLQQYRR